MYDLWEVLLMPFERIVVENHLKTSMDSAWSGFSLTVQFCWISSVFTDISLQVHTTCEHNRFDHCIPLMLADM